MESNTPQMPPEIAKAVVKVMGEVKKLGKDEKNAHGGYNYVSVDQFFDQVGKLMAEAGIFVLVNEAESSIDVRETTDQYGKTKKSAWLSTAYDLHICHDSGAMFGPLRRHQQVSATGPQSYGASEAYVEKYFLRNLFKIPTGEADADADAQDGLPTTHKRAPTPPKPPEPQITVQSSTAMRDKLIASIGTCSTPRELKAWEIENSGAERFMFPADVSAVGGALDERYEQFKELTV